MAGIVPGDAARLMSCYYDATGRFVCATRQGEAARTPKEQAREESQVLAQQLRDRELVKVRLADALAAGGMGADLDGYVPTLQGQLGYEEPPQAGSALEGARRLPPDRGMQLSNLLPQPHPVVPAAAARRPSVPQVAAMTYSAA
jgi:hypothetical protein